MNLIKAYRCQHAVTLLVIFTLFISGADSFIKRAGSLSCAHLTGKSRFICESDPMGKRSNLPKYRQINWAPTYTRQHTNQYTDDRNPSIQKLQVKGIFNPYDTDESALNKRDFNIPSRRDFEASRWEDTHSQLGDYSSMRNSQRATMREGDMYLPVHQANSLWAENQSDRETYEDMINRLPTKHSYNNQGDRLDNDYTSIQSRSSELQSILNKLTRRAERPSFMI